MILYVCEGGEEQVDDELRTIIVNMLSSGPKLLKAPLGSGGFGLYFVYSCTGQYLSRTLVMSSVRWNLLIVYMP